MYESFYGLRDKPFDLHPDPDYLYMSQGHENAYTNLEYAICENKCFVVVTGEIGSGKTTLINFLLEKIPHGIEVGIVNRTDASSLEFIKMVCQEFEIDVSGFDKAEMLDALNLFLLEHFAAKTRVVLIIDEAQNLPRKTIEEIRMLSNLESEKHHLIQIIMVGQPELRATLRQKGMEQFAQRVTVHCHLDGLPRAEVGEYIRYRLKVGGATNLGIFTEDAIEFISEQSRGIPRLINIICDSALVFGYADGLKVIDRSVIEAVIKSREAGGLFTTGPWEEPCLSTTDDASVREQLKAIERRMAFLEDLVGGLNRRLTQLSDRREERDGLVLELFKMLKGSMESRWNIILQFMKLRKRLELLKGLSRRAGPDKGSPQEKINPVASPPTQRHPDRSDL
jgi:general secretion pathway protein A